MTATPRNCTVTGAPSVVFFPFRDTVYVSVERIITQTPLKHSLANLKTNKAPGPDGITAELLQEGGDTLHEWLFVLITSIFETRIIPTQLETSEIITLFKKNDPLNCANYRPISLLNHVYKLVMQIIYSRIKQDLIAVLPNNQAAYQPGRGTVEQIQIIQQIIEKAHKYQSPCVICFVDYTKAFDSVDQAKLWEVLSDYTWIDSAYINLLAKLYENSTTRVRTHLGNTDIIYLRKGVKQGDFPSAVFFCVILLVILLYVFEYLDFGFSLGGQTFSDVDYACLLYTSPSPRDS